MAMMPKRWFIEEWRTYRGLSLRELALRAGVELRILFELEIDQSTPDLALLRKLAVALEVEDEELFSSPHDPEHGAVQEAARVLHRLGQVAQTYRDHGGAGLGYQFSRRRLTLDPETLLDATEEALQLLIPLWLDLHAYQTAGADDDGEHATTMIAGESFYAKNLTQGGVPADLAEALSRAVSQRLAEVLSEVTGKPILTPLPERFPAADMPN
jgi:transcriptional regulator with XRE-family HTH domain